MRESEVEIWPGWWSPCFVQIFLRDLWKPRRTKIFHEEIFFGFLCFNFCSSPPSSTMFYMFSREKATDLRWTLIVSDGGTTRLAMVVWRICGILKISLGSYFPRRTIVTPGRLGQKSSFKGETSEPGVSDFLLSNDEQGSEPHPQGLSTSRKRRFPTK